MKRFEGKSILVTGAGSGIGAACVRRLFAEGASIAAADVRKEEVDKVVSEFGDSPMSSFVSSITGATSPSISSHRA